VLEQFEEEAITDPEILKYLSERVTVICDEERFKSRGHYSTDLRIVTKDGNEYCSSIDIPPGTPEYPMTEEEQTARYYDCLNFADIPWVNARADELLSRLRSLENESNALEVFALLLP
jgi:2-methylcitrate dehydratase PrpD